MSAGLTEDECWAMTLRQIVRTADAAKLRHERDAGLWAAQTAELVNMIGGAVAGKKWKTVTAADYFRAWTGRSLDKGPNSKEIRAQLLEAQKEHERLQEATNGDD